MIDPSVDTTATLRQIETLASAIRSRIPQNATRQTKLEVLVNSLQQPGPWNDSRPFQYDLQDPFGKSIQNKLLSRYLASRKGNCVSMPILFVILGQRIGLDVTLARAPQHVLAKFKNDAGVWINIETTSFGTKSDASYQHEMGITPKAVQNHVYLYPLTRRESMGVVVETLLEAYAQRGQDERRIVAANMLLELNPNDVTALLHKGSAHARIIKSQYVGKFPSPNEMPDPIRLKFEFHAKQNRDSFARAESLGWREPTAQQDADYLRQIKQVNARQGERR
jgi:regulator of sirC expression with transglutaminase-like and TPR domain